MPDTARKTTDPQVTRALARAILRSEMRAEPKEARSRAALNAVWAERRTELMRTATRVLLSLDRQGYVVTPPPGKAADAAGDDIGGA